VRAMARRASVPEVTTRVRLFGVSYAPLFGLLALRFDGTRLRLALAAAAIAFFADGVRIAVAVPKRVGASPFTVTVVSDRGDQVAGYLATYLLPFLVVPSPRGVDLVAYGIFLVIACVVTVRSNLTHVNPTLYLLGYRLVGLTTAEGFSGSAIVRQDLQVGNVLHATHLGHDVLVEAR
jgi:hypothetical protein